MSKLKKTADAGDGSYLVLCSTNASYGESTEPGLFIAKVSDTGTVVWMATPHQDFPLKAYGIAAGVDGRFAVAGSSGDPVLIAFNASGQELWRYENIGGDGVYNLDVVTAPDGGYVFSGFDGDTGFFAAGLSADGTELWKKEGAEVGGHFVTVHMTPTRDGGTVLVSQWGSRMKLNRNGDLVWNKSAGSESITIARDVTGRAGGDFAMVGSSGTRLDFTIQCQHMHLVRFDEEGNRVWNGNIGRRDNTSPGGVTELADGNLLVAGNAAVNGRASIYLVTMDAGE